MAKISGEAVYLRCPYQATIMKTFEATRSTMGATAGSGMVGVSKVGNLAGGRGRGLSAR
jgi:hypothetical protein